MIISEISNFRRNLIVICVILLIAFFAILSWIFSTYQYPHSQLKIRKAFRRDAKPDEFPHMVNIGPFQCGGTIITKNLILTAEHCASYEIVVAGEINKNDFSSQGIWRYVAKIFIHPDNLNIAILYISKPFIFNEKIHRALIPQKSYITPYRLIAVGWGLSNYNCSETISPILQTKILDVEDDSLWNIKTITHKLRSITCFGDSGSGLVEKTEDDEYIVVGVVQKQNETICEDYDGIEYFKKVTYFLPWLHEVVHNVTETLN